MQPLEIELQIKLVFQTFPNINLICCNQSQSTKLPDDGATAADSHFTTLGVKFAPFPVSLSLSPLTISFRKETLTPPLTSLLGWLRLHMRFLAPISKGDLAGYKVIYCEVHISLREVV